VEEVIKISDNGKRDRNKDKEIGRNAEGKREGKREKENKHSFVASTFRGYTIAIQ
jgi:hypothetical protein